MLTTLTFRIIENGDKLFDSARLSDLDGDEEIAYIFYMRCTALYQKALKAANDKKYVKNYDVIYIAETTYAGLGLVLKLNLKVGGGGAGQVNEL